MLVPIAPSYTTTRSLTVCRKSAINKLCHSERSEGPAATTPCHPERSRGTLCWPQITIESLDPLHRPCQRPTTTDQRLVLTQTPTSIRRPALCAESRSSQLPCTGNAGAPVATSVLLNTAFAPMCAGAAASICSFRITRSLTLNVASSNPCPGVIASVGQASTQYPQKIHRL